MQYFSHALIATPVARVLPVKMTSPIPQGHPDTSGRACQVR